MKTLLNPIKHLALDLDGTLYLGGRLFEWTRPFLQQAAQLGIGRTFFTNNSSKSTRQYIQSLRSMGIDASESEIYSSTHSTFDYLREEHPQARRVYVLGTPSLREEFTENGYTVVGESEADEPDAVIVGFDMTLSYDRVCRAAWWIGQGRPFIATHPDKVCPTDKPTCLVDCGAMCRMLAYATGREPDAVLGKPSWRMLAGIIKRHGVQPGQIAVVGDRLYTDMAMARSGGAVGVLVLSGETTRAQAEVADPRPDLVVEHVGELGHLLASRVKTPETLSC